MFAIYPGFEDLSLRVEVEWCGRQRPVVARLEQWPESNSAVLVCAFADDSNDGEWIVIGNSLIPYQLGNPYNLVGETKIYEVETREPILEWKRQDQRKEKVRQMVRKAFENKPNYTVARLLKLDELSSEPRAMMRTLRKSAWMPDYSYPSWIEFEEQAQPNLTEIQETQRILREWEDVQSPTRFSWEWTRLNDEQRKRQMGFDGDSEELSRVMYWALAAKPREWQENDFFRWSFEEIETTGQLQGRPYNAANFSYIESEIELLWEQILLAHFVANWRADWVTKYQCVRQWLDSQLYNHSFGYAELSHLPTAHEQLEAKLALREWLRDKATPAVAAQLLASLES